MTDMPTEPEENVEPVDGLDEGAISPEEAKAEEEAAKLGDFA